MHILLMMGFRPFKSFLTRVFFYAIEGVTLIYLLLQIAHIMNPEDSKTKKPFAITQMVIITLLVIGLLVISIIISLISLIKWSWESSGAKSFVNSK